MLRVSCVLLAISFFGFSGLSRADDGGRAMKLEDLFRYKRVADPQVSPDGKYVAYVVTAVNLEANSTNADIWLVPAAGGAPRQLTTAPKADRHPRWSPDGKQILFESTRSGDSQLWLINVDGGEARQLTSIATGASTGIWSPDGRNVAFVSAVYPEHSSKPYKESNELNKKRLEEIEKNPVKAKVLTRLFYRHWDEWVEDKRQHLFVIPAIGGEPRDITPGDRDGYPTSTTFSAGDDFTFSPDGKYLVYTAPPEREEAWSTNYDIFRVPVQGGIAECLTRENKAADGAPQFSPDGKTLAYRAQSRPGFEADRWEIALAPCDTSGLLTGPRRLAKPKYVGESPYDLSVDSFLWKPDGKSVWFLAEKDATSPIFQWTLQDPSCSPVVSGGTNGALSMSRDGSVLAFSQASLRGPNEVRALIQNEQRSLTTVNKDLQGELNLSKPESVTVTGAGGKPMQMWILMPPAFDAAKKWPLVYLVHGGPQGAWEDGWSFRWNPQLWAAQGYVIAMPNPRGSTGFGQKYVDEISGDWGGKCYEDLMAGVAYLENLPYLDKDRMASAGASFGGYMMNWFQGNTTKFKTLITHCGVYNFDSMYATTDELWFDEWEHGGPPWGKNRASYEKHSPHRFAKNFKTPMLIIHNDLDFRVPVSEGHQLFTTLQRLGVPSRFVNFPDEGHWVLKPANSAYWHKEVFAWLKKYVPPGGR